MGFFDDFFGQKAIAEKREKRKLEVLLEDKVRNNHMNDYNQRYSLPFNGPGTCYEGHDFHARQVERNRYEVMSKRHTYGGLFGGAAPIHSLTANNPFTGNAHLVDAGTMRRIIDGEHFPQYDLYRMSKEEVEELKELEKELRVWKKQEELNKYKLLPSHIRQEIVDEALLVDLMGNAEPLNQKFEYWERMQELRHRENEASSYSNHVHAGNYNGPSPSGGFTLKYGPILNKFKTDELLEAHAEASLEEEIAD